MTFGWMGKFLDVNLTTRTTQVRDTMPYAHAYLGGRGIADRLAWENIPPGTDAFSHENRLIFFTGPLTGTIAPTSGRSVFVSVSPRVYPRPWISHSTMGGWFGPELKYAGFDGIMLGGKADQPVYIYIVDGRIEFRDASDLWGKGTRETQELLKRRHGAKNQVICIGPAGENLSRLGVIHHADECASGFCGFGGVMGSKKLKAIVVRGTGGVQVAHPKDLLAELAVVRDVAWVNPLVRFLEDPKVPSSFGTVKDRPICSQSCTVTCGTHILRRVEGLPDAIMGCNGREYSGELYAKDEYITPGYEGGGVKLPRTVHFGVAGGVRVHGVVNDVGLDLYLLVTLQPWFTRCIERGIDSIRGTRLNPTDPDWFIDLMNGMAHRKGLGGIFTDGLRRAADTLEGELPDDLVALARSQEFAFGFPAHREGRLLDPEPLPYWVISALMYASESRDPAVGTHTAILFLANLYIQEGEEALKKFRKTGEKIWGDSRSLEPSFEAVVPVAVWTQHQHILIDSLTLCGFAFPRTVRAFHNRQEWEQAEDTQPQLDIGRLLFTACTGVDLTDHDLDVAAERIFNLERANLAEYGRNRKIDSSIEPHFELPCSTDGTKLDMQLFDELLDAFYELRGWDLEQGWPIRKKLVELGLADVADRLGR